MPLVKLIKERGSKLLSINGNRDSRIGVESSSQIVYSIVPGTEPAGGVPTRSVVAQEMVVNAIVCEIIKRTDFKSHDFKYNHPGGNLGKIL